LKIKLNEFKSSKMTIEFCQNGENKSDKTLPVIV